MVKKILVALDGSPSSNKALDLAIQLARSAGAHLVALAVISSEPLVEADIDLALAEYQPEVSALLVDPAFAPTAALESAPGRPNREVPRPTSIQLHKAMAEHVLAQANNTARRLNFPGMETLARSGDPAATILAFAAAEAPDLLVMGSRGLSQQAKTIMGTVSYRVVHEVACPVIIVKSLELED